MRWWKILLASLLLISVLALAACSPKTAPEAEAMPTIRLSEVTRSIFYAPLYVALANGYFEEEGVNIELSTAFGGDKVMTYLLTNEADVGFVGAETSIYVYQQAAATSSSTSSSSPKGTASFWWPGSPSRTSPGK